MKELQQLIAIANSLDEKGMTKEADKLDRIIQKMAQHMPHDDDDDFGMFDPTGERGPTEEDMAMLQSMEDWGGPEATEPYYAMKDAETFGESLEELEDKMKLFILAIEDGKMQPQDWEQFEQLKEAINMLSEYKGRAEKTLSEVPEA